MLDLMLVWVMMSRMQGGKRKGRQALQEERAGSVVKLRRCSLARGCPPLLLLLLRPTDIDSRGHCSLTSLFHNRFHKSRHFFLVFGLQGVTWPPGKVEQVEIWETHHLVLLHSTLVLASFKSWQKGKENYHNNDLEVNESLLTIS